MTTVARALLKDTQELYDELLKEHEIALDKIDQLSKRIIELEHKLNVPKVLLDCIQIKGDPYVLAKLIEISSIQSINGGISIKFNDMTTTFLWTSLKKYQEQLPLLYFKRISKSCIINIENIVRRVGNSVELKNGDRFTISNTYKNVL